jgi:RNA polymerase sigma factor (sigma-70 family)
MLSRVAAEPVDAKLRHLDPIELFRICASDRENSTAWSDFLGRYTSKIKYFIRGTLRQFAGSAANLNSSMLSGGIQESDLFQNAIIRLVANDCAAMKRFSGKDENDILAYLAVISRSAVLDWLRQGNAIKRGHEQQSPQTLELALSRTRNLAEESDHEQKVLFGELVSITKNAIASHSGQASNRDQLVFDLHFLQGLSFSQISQCKGINLSKAGVEKLLNRLVSRVQILAKTGKSSETAQ